MSFILPLADSRVRPKEFVARVAVGIARDHPSRSENDAMALSTNVHDTALIFEGGGMRAAYTAAVVVELLRQEIHFDWVAGISAGSSNTANYVSRDAGRAHRCFVDFAADPRFGGWQHFLRRRGMFNAHYIYQEAGLPGKALPFDYDTFMSNPARASFGTFEADTGRSFYWTKDDIASMQDLMVRVQSSSTLPILMPIVHIGDHAYVDGALGPSGGIALDAAKAAGFEKFLVVLTRPRSYVKKPTKLTPALRAAFRKYPAIADGNAARAANYNSTRTELLDLEAQGQAKVFFPTGELVTQAERDVATLERSFQCGAAQIAQEIDSWKDFLF